MASPRIGAALRSNVLSPRESFGGWSGNPAVGADSRLSDTEVPDLDAFILAPAPRPSAKGLIVGAVNWDRDPGGLLAGDLSSLPMWIAAGILAMSAEAEVAELAKSLGVSAVTAAVLLLAEADGKKSRTAARIARKGLAGADGVLLERARKALGL